jgi:toxin FitB
VPGALLQVAEEIFAEDFGGRISGFESNAVRACAEISAERRALGRPISHADAQIAAIAQVRGAKLATRSIANFVDCHLDLLDPWSEA